mgnify:CR=1 FL=1
MDSTLIKGDTTELQCILAFQSRGYYCSVPFSGSCRYDLIVDINNKLFKIQCKSSVCHQQDGVLLFSTSRTTTNTKETVRYSYSKDEVDYFYTYWNNYHFLVPIEETSTTSKSLRISKPLQGIQSQMSIAADYLIDNVLKSIINNTNIDKYCENCLQSKEEDGIKTWTKKELNEVFNERQIRYIKECAAKGKMGYNKYWMFKEFPVL